MEAVALFLTVLFARYGRVILGLLLVVLAVAWAREHPAWAAGIALALGFGVVVLIGANRPPPKS